MQQKQPAEFRPEFRIIAEGQDITAIIRENLVDISITDNGGATGKTDELQITLLSETLKLPPKGARLSVALGFNGQLVDKGWFVVSGRASSGPPRKIQLYATSAPMNAQKQPGNVQSQKSRSWDGVTLGDIVKTVATDNGLIPKIAAQLADIAIEHIDQVRESDAALMTRLARAHNAVSKAAGGYWLFLEQGEATTASGGALSNVKITREALSSWSYSDGQRGATTGKPAKTADGKGKKGKVSVSYFDPADGRTKTQSLEHDGPDQANPFTQPSKAQADSSAKSKMTQANRNERRMTLSGPGRPQYVPLTAESRITTAGFGEEEDRTWLIESLAFSLSSSGLAMAFNLVTDIKPPAESKAKAAKKEKKSDGIGYFD